MWLRKYWTLEAYRSLISYIPSSCVIGIVWVSLSVSARALLGMEAHLFFWILLAVSSLHGLLLLLHLALAKLMHLQRAERISFVIVGSQKTLPIALSVLSALNPPQLGAAVLVCLVFHFSQLFIDSFIAARWAKIA